MTPSADHSARTAAGEARTALLPRHVPMWLLVAGALIGIVRVAIALPLARYGSDFVPIWEAVQRYTQGIPVYNEDYSTTDPHYLYGPGANVVLAPLALFGSFEVGRWAMVGASVASISGALYWAARMIAPTKAVPLTLGAIAIAYNVPEPVQSTVYLTNINGFLLLVMVAFVHACLRGYRGSKIVAALLLAYAVTIKPQFVVLVSVPFLLAQWWVIVGGVAAYAALFGIGWATTVNPHWYIERLVPYLSETRNYDNGAIAAFGLGPAGTFVASAVLLIGVFAAVAVLFPQRRELGAVWAFCMLGALFSGVFLAGGLLQGYYSIWLIPLAMTAADPRSPSRTWAIGLALWPTTGLVALPAAPSLLATLGWAVVPFAIAVHAGLRWKTPTGLLPA